VVVAGANGERDPAEPRRRWILAAAWGAVAIGVLLRLLAVSRMDIWEDGVEYAKMGHVWSQGQGFLLPDSERFGRTPTSGPGYSHHFPPAFPFALGLIFWAFGFGVAQAKAGLLAVSLAALAAVYATTRNLYGADRAVLVAGIVAVEPSLIWVTGIGLSENFTLLFATLTMWAFLRSLTQAWYILPAGMCWTVVYLARSSAGAFGIVPAVAAAWWWLRFRGWRALLNGWCVAAGVVFAAAVLLWGWRNYRHFGDWETSAYVSAIYDFGFAHPALMAKALAGKGAFFLLFLLAYALPFLPEVRASFRRLREAEVSILWLFVGVIWSLAWLVSAAFWPYEQRPFFFLEHHRYILLGLVPLLWIVVRGVADTGVLLVRWAGLAAVLLVASVGVLLSPVRESSARAAEFIDAYLRDGDTIVVGGSIHKYDIDVYLSRIDRVSVWRNRPPRPPQFAFLGDQRPVPMPPGFDLVGTFVQQGEPPSATYVIAPVEVIQERGLPTGVTHTYR
jgi:hypothetical protein